ncbi:MAG: hypothetical protein V4689_07220 [Verrucomicrobiota bacterium]
MAPDLRIFPAIARPLAALLPAFPACFSNFPLHSTAFSAEILKIPVKMNGKGDKIKNKTAKTDAQANKF